MIIYTCAKCREELEVEENLAGRRVKCPHCANVEVVAGVAGVARPAKRSGVAEQLPLGLDRATAMGLPPDSGPEVEVLRVHPVMFRARPLVGLGLASLILGGIGLAIAGQFAATFANYRWAAFAGLGLLLMGLVWVALWKLKAMGTMVIVTNKRTTVRRGLLSKRTREILHDQVKDIEVVQTFGQRMLRTGTLGIDGSGTDQIELVVDDLPSPDRLRKSIDAYRNIG